MFLIVGLGNTDAQYKKTRHNTGRIFVDYLAGSAAFGQSAGWEEKKRLCARIADVTVGQHQILLAQPLTYMNDSGHAVAALAHFFKVSPDHVLVAHDDIDLPLGRWKLHFNRGAGGHHGVESVIKAFGTTAFWRLRIGIAPQNRAKPHDAADFVLKPFSKKELEVFESHFSDLEAVVRAWLTQKR